MDKINQPRHSPRAARLNPRSKKISVRVFHRFYPAVIASLYLIALVCWSFDKTGESIAFMVLGCVVMPLVAHTDRIVFDGTTITRTGPLNFIRSLIRNRQVSLHYSEVELVETEAVRTMRHNGSAKYQYRTKISGQNLRFTVASGGNSYRLFVNRLLDLLAPAKLDARSAELRDYLCDEKALRATRESLQIAPPEVLENTIIEPSRARRRTNRTTRGAESPIDETRARRLRFAANRLRIAGRLRESGEAFRRAMLAMPPEDALLYDFARYLFSAASLTNDAALVARANAALRLAARRAARRGDAPLLLRIGEALAERGETPWAAKVFQLVLEIDPRQVRASIGLAHLALRSGKLAHVVHHYGAASRVAPDAALQRFARREADYYARLDNDDSYLNAEVKRISLLQNMRQVGETAARTTLLAVVFASTLMFVDEKVAAAAWSLAAATATAWIALTLGASLFANRRRVTSDE